MPFAARQPRFIFRFFSLLMLFFATALFRRFLPLIAALMLPLDAALRLLALITPLSHYYKMLRRFAAAFLRASATRRDVLRALMMMMIT